MADGKLPHTTLVNFNCNGRAAHMAMTMAYGKLPHTTLLNFSCAARWVHEAHGKDNGKWQATSHYSRKVHLRRAPGARHTWQ
eukprot:2921817-Karenia_brevis.AAC.1